MTFENFIDSVNKKTNEEPEMFVFDKNNIILLAKPWDEVIMK